MHYDLLLGFYRVAYPDSHFCDYLRAVPDRIKIGPKIEKFETARIHGHRYRSAEAESRSGSYVQALFQGFNDDNVQSWSGQVLYYFKHTIVIRGQAVPHVFALVRWFQEYRPSQPFEAAGLEVWKDDYRPLHTDSILPVHRIFSPVAIAKYTAPRSQLELIVTIPLQKKTFA